MLSSFYFDPPRWGKSLILETILLLLINYRIHGSVFIYAESIIEKNTYFKNRHCPEGLCCVQAQEYVL